MCVAAGCGAAHRRSGSPHGTVLSRPPLFGGQHTIASGHPRLWGCWYPARKCKIYVWQAFRRRTTLGSDGAGAQGRRWERMHGAFPAADSRGSGGGGGGDPKGRALCGQAQADYFGRPPLGCGLFPGGVARRSQQMQPGGCTHKDLKGFIKGTPHTEEAVARARNRGERLRGPRVHRDSRVTPTAAATVSPGAVTESRHGAHECFHRDGVLSSRGRATQSVRKGWFTPRCCPSRSRRCRRGTCGCPSA